MRTLPHAVESERALLGAVLQMPRLADDAAELEPEHMHDPRNQHVWRAVRELQARSRQVDAVSVGQQLADASKLEPIGGFAYLSKLVADRPAGAASVARYAEVIREKATARELMAVLGELLDRGYNDPDTGGLLEEAQARVFALTGDREKTAARPFKAVLRASCDAFEARKLAGGLPGASTGFPDLDKLLAGWQPGDVVILGGRSSMGKTALAMALATGTANAGTPTYVFSVEMSGEQLADRALCSEAALDSQRYRMGEADTREMARLTMAVQRLAPLPLVVDDSTAVTVAQIRARVRRWAAAQRKPGLVVVDYLQLVTAVRIKGGSREQEVAEISKQLKAIARETGCTVLALAQLSRELEKRSNKRPVLSDLRESGSLEQDADAVLFVYRDAYYDPKAQDKTALEVICAKQRTGPIGTVTLTFDEASGRISPRSNRREF